MMQKKNVRVAVIAVLSGLCAAAAYWVLKEIGSSLVRACLVGIASGIGAVAGVLIGKRIKD